MFKTDGLPRRVECLNLVRCIAWGPLDWGQRQLTEPSGSRPRSLPTEVPSHDRAGAPIGAVVLQYATEFSSHRHVDLYGRPTGMICELHCRAITHRKV
jgi:hypothetical protein